MSRRPESGRGDFPKNEFKKPKEKKSPKKVEKKVSSTNSADFLLTEYDRLITLQEYSQLINALYDPVGRLLFQIKEAGIALSKKEQVVLMQHLSKMKRVVAQMRLVIARQRHHLTQENQKISLGGSQIKAVNTFQVELSVDETHIFEVDIARTKTNQFDEKYNQAQTELTEAETALNDLEKFFFPLFTTSPDPQNSERVAAMLTVPTFYSLLDKFEGELQMMKISSTNISGELNTKVIANLQSLLGPLEERIATIEDSTKRIEIFTLYNQLNNLLKLILVRVRNLSRPNLSPQPQSTNSPFQPSELDIFIKNLVTSMKKLGMSLAPLGFPGGIEGNAIFPLEERVRIINGQEWSKDFIEIEIWTRKLNGARGKLIKVIFVEGARKVFTRSEDGEFFTEPRDLSPEDEKKFAEARKLFYQMVNDPRNKGLLFRMIDNVGISKSALGKR